MELEAYNVGSRAVSAQVTAGYPWKDLNETDHFQRQVEVDRERYNRGKSDPYTPSWGLMLKYKSRLLRDNF